jgi:signal recognition particle receptor subunit beta
LVFCNKQDISGALKVSEIKDVINVLNLDIGIRKYNYKALDDIAFLWFDRR